ncbi:MAG: Uma2 family endonuclease [Cyanobacteria bacterium J06626_6]
MANTPIVADDKSRYDVAARSDAVDHGITAPDASQLITEDDTPVDNFASAKQQRLLVSSLYSAFARSTPDTIFLAESDVGIFHADGKPPVVPDVFVSFDVQVPENWWDKPNRSYLMWKFGKPPEIVIEVVSNQVGNELESKLATYEDLRISYYAVYDPSHQLGEETLQLFELRGRRYAAISDLWMEQVKLGLTLWEGDFEGRTDLWLRWCDKEGKVFFTGDEQAELAQQKVEQVSTRAEQAERRAERLAAILKAQGIDPDILPDV